MEQTDNTKTLANAPEENARLQADNRRNLQRIAELEAQIKAAQEQEPVRYYHTNSGIDSGLYTLEDIKEGFPGKYSPVYAAPVPAQQSPAVLFNGSHGHAGYVVDDQQSPAVAVPDDWVFVPRKPTKEMVDAFNNAEEEFQHGIGAAPDCHWTAMIDSSPKNSYVHHLQIENKSLAHSVERYSHEYDFLEMQLKQSIREGDKLLKEIECLQKKLREKDKSLNHALDQLAQSPRITEQDAREIAVIAIKDMAEEFKDGWPDHIGKYDFMIGYSCRVDGRTLLDKLNGVKSE